jgi:L-iditol 2-dehydrogenase
MRTVKLTGIRQMNVMEVPDPQIINSSDVLIKMTTIGVCGSDMHYYTTGRIGDQVVTYPFTIGHEGAGIVEKIGSAVTMVKPGDRIAIDPAMPCGQCDQCKVGRPHTCRKLLFLGCPGQVEGCLSEYLVMPETSCFPIPEKLTLLEAALSEPLSIGVYAVKLSKMKPRLNVGILGCGPIGLSVLAALSVNKPGNIYVTDKLDYRLGFAKQSGALWTGNPNKTEITKEITTLQPLLLDIVYECCGRQEAIDQAITLLKPGGQLVIVGIPETYNISFKINDLRRKEICIQNVRRQNESVHDSLFLLSSGLINIKPWATHRFKLNETQQAFDLVANYSDNVIKAMIEID